MVGVPAAGHGTRLRLRLSTPSRLLETRDTGLRGSSVEAGTVAGFAALAAANSAVSERCRKGFTPGRALAFLRPITAARGARKRRAVLTCAAPATIVRPELRSAAPEVPEQQWACCVFRRDFRAKTNRAGTRLQSSACRRSFVPSLASRVLRSDECCCRSRSRGKACARHHRVCHWCSWLRGRSPGSGAVASRHRCARHWCVLA